MKVFILFLISIFLAHLISASCTESQVDVNTASLEELDSLAGIGPAKAQEIISSRPFDSIDDLINVKGIGEVTLSNIKTQGLACVDEEKDAKDKEEINETKHVKDSVEEVGEFVPEKEVVVETINLKPKAIKTDTPKGSLKKNFALSGLGVFCVLLAVLFIVKKKRYKNEFK